MSFVRTRSWRRCSRPSTFLVILSPDPPQGLLGDQSVSEPVRTTTFTNYRLPSCEPINLPVFYFGDGALPRIQASADTSRMMRMELNNQAGQIRAKYYPARAGGTERSS